MIFNIRILQFKANTHVNIHKKLAFNYICYIILTYIVDLPQISEEKLTVKDMVTNMNYYGFG